MLLKVASGSDAGRLFQLPEGRIVYAGRDPRAEICLPDDTTLAPIHCSFQVLLENCLLTGLNTDGRILLNGRRVLQALLAPGDQIMLGTTLLNLLLMTQLTDSPESAANPPETLTEFSQRLHYPAADAMPDWKDFDCLPLAFYAELRKRCLWEPAADFLCHWLPPENAIDWCLQAIDRLLRNSPDDYGLLALTTTRNWRLETSEVLRRQAETLAQNRPPDCPFRCLLLAVFYSGDSLAPQGLPPATPPTGLTAKVASLCLTLVARRLNPATPHAPLQELVLAAETEFCPQGPQHVPS